MKNLKSQKKGFAALLTIIVISAATLIIAFNSSILGIGEIDVGYTSQKGSEVFAIADGCMEESLRRFRLNTSYSGENLTTNNGTCIIEVSASSANATSTVTASTTDSYYSKLETTFSFTDDTRPVITITSWEEKID